MVNARFMLGATVVALLALSIALPMSFADEGEKKAEDDLRCNVLFDNGIGTAIVEFRGIAVVEGGLLSARQAHIVLLALNARGFWKDRRWTGHSPANDDSYGEDQGATPAGLQMVVRYRKHRSKEAEVPLIKTIDQLTNGVIRALNRQPGITLERIANGYRGDPADDINGHFIDPGGRGRIDSDYPWDNLGPIWGFNGLTEEGKKRTLPKDFDRSFFVVPHVRNGHGLEEARVEFDPQREALKKKDPSKVYVTPSDPVSSWPCQLKAGEQFDRLCGAMIIPLTSEQIRNRRLGRKYGKGLDESSLGELVGKFNKANGTKLTVAQLETIVAHCNRAYGLSGRPRTSAILVCEDKDSARVCVIDPCHTLEGLRVIGRAVNVGKPNLVPIPQPGK